ncbi:copper amine oxidase N-terminal domain-containing protein [Paenibacillus elgii]|uniref:copper amine oxidase N-terminal domain-containing protein n=1 Tax=Paenibacillus elgii TaxID=189691 RepID=UPI002041321C|nr:copper amine oxidase N-terminal domain-containing protein [Paenibacillus elgii]MCM3271087.1 copper amine oxidase N-terminal domain-containing protein [Paenibacillus elgii]
MILRKWSMLLAIVAVLLSVSVVGTVQASATEQSPIKVYIDKSRIHFNVNPYLENGTTLVQLRPLFEAMGIALDWKPESSVIEGKKGSLRLVLTIGSKQATVNGKTVQLETAARIVDGNTLVPLRFIGEATGALVVWDPYSQEITIMTEQMLASLGITKKDAEKAIADYLASKEQGSKTDNGGKKPEQGTKTEGRNEADDEIAPAVKADLNDLKGMYFGIRMDVTGYECGGTCWDFYTFLPDGKVVIGEPEKGGPETIDCSKQACRTYTIENGTMKLNNGENYPIRVSEKGNLIVNDVLLSPVQPVTGSATLEGAFVHRGYSGMIGINSASSAWEEWITFKKNGTFESDNTLMGTVDTGSATTNSASASNKSGSYSIEGNTIVLKFDGGTEKPYLFFFHNDKNGKPNFEDVQIGNRNFYIDRD